MSLFEKKAKALTAFDKIGKSNGSSPPESADNRASIAYEYYVADFLASAADKRKKEAKVAAINAGIEAVDPKPGDNKIVYENEHMTITARTASPASRIDASKLRTELIKLHGSDEADKIIRAATVENKASTSYIFAGK